MCVCVCACVRARARARARVCVCVRLGVEGGVGARLSYHALYQASPFGPRRLLFPVKFQVIRLPVGVFITGGGISRPEIIGRERHYSQLLSPLSYRSRLVYRHMLPCFLSLFLFIACFWHIFSPSFSLFDYLAQFLPTVCQSRQIMSYTMRRAARCEACGAYRAFCQSALLRVTTCRVSWCFESSHPRSSKPQLTNLAHCQRSNADWKRAI